MTLALILLAAIIGAISTIQSSTNGLLAGRIGLTTAVMINGAVVFGGALLFWLLSPRGEVDSTAPRPWFLYLGGVYGLSIIAGAAFCFPRLGAGPTTAIMVSSMLLASIVFDHLGLPSEKIPVTPSRLLGCGLLVVGALLVLWPKIAASSAR